LNDYFLRTKNKILKAKQKCTQILNYFCFLNELVTLMRKNTMIKRGGENLKDNLNLKIKGWNLELHFEV